MVWRAMWLPRSRTYGLPVVTISLKTHKECPKSADGSNFLERNMHERLLWIDQCCNEFLRKKNYLKSVPREYWHAMVSSLPCILRSPVLSCNYQSYPERRSGAILLCLNYSLSHASCLLSVIDVIYDLYWCTDVGLLVSISICLSVCLPASRTEFRHRPCLHVDTCTVVVLLFRRNQAPRRRKPHCIEQMFLHSEISAILVLKKK